MKLKYTLLTFLLLGFAGCSDSDDGNEAVNVIDGTYSSECIEVDNESGDNTSKISHIIFSTTEDGVRQRAARENTYTGVMCDAGKADGPSVAASNVTFADYGFGNGVSYYTGATNSTPYHLDGNVLYEGTPVESSSITEEAGETSADIFAGFIETPVTDDSVGHTRQ